MAQSNHTCLEFAVYDRCLHATKAVFSRPVPSPPAQFHTRSRYRKQNCDNVSKHYQYPRGVYRVTKNNGNLKFIIRIQYKTETL
ncbi:hypothetical protein Mapa_015281 [Marchantia paleacea]|nr:hypothetical protein Mapa_015281 [Marchantia paleacea]